MHFRCIPLHSQVDPDEEVEGEEVEGEGEGTIVEATISEVRWLEREKMQLPQATAVATSPPSGTLVWPLRATHPNCRLLIV